MLMVHEFNAARGYHAVYRENEINHCPGCGRTHWLIGRASAECAFCGTALPLAEGINAAADHRPTFVQRGKNHGKVR
jgi:hypothetical protein